MASHGGYCVRWLWVKARRQRTVTVETSRTYAQCIPNQRACKLQTRNPALDFSQSKTWLWLRTPGFAISTLKKLKVALKVKLAGARFASRAFPNWELQLGLQSSHTPLIGLQEGKGENERRERRVVREGEGLGNIGPSQCVVRIDADVFVYVYLPACDGGRQWTDCGGCEMTCLRELVKLPCTRNCRRGCHCPYNLPVWHEGQCITEDQCPGLHIHCEPKKTWQYIWHYNSGKTPSIFIIFALL